MTEAVMALRAKLVGVSNYADVVSGLEVGDTLSVRHEPDNAYDPNAMQVTDRDGRVVGYLAKEVAKRVIEKDSTREFTATVDTVTEHDGAVVGGFITFETAAGYLTPVEHTNKRKEGDMSRFALPDEVTEQGAEGWESDRISKVRAFRLPSGQPITVIPITDYTTANDRNVDGEIVKGDGGWMSMREVKAFGGLRMPGEQETIDLPGRLITFPVQDYVLVKGKDGKVKRQFATDPLLERIAPSKFECKKPRNASDDWEPPRHTKPKDVTYVNCVFIEGKFETGDRAKYNPKPGDHILLTMATTWYEDWKRLMERDRKKEKDYSPAGRYWTLKIAGSFDAGNLAFEADDEIGDPVPLPDLINLHDWTEAKRTEVDQWVAALDGVSHSVHYSEPESEPVDDAEDVAAFEDAVQDMTDGYDWSGEPPARKKKLLTAIGVKVAPTAKKEELDALVVEHEAALLEYLAAEAA